MPCIHLKIRTEHWECVLYRASVLQAASPKNRRKRAAQARHTAKTMSFILSKDHLHTTPGIHAFLGLATLPRFQTKANPMRLLPREIIDRIARLAHRDAYLAAWDTGAPGGILPTSIDITRLNDEEDVTLRMARPLRTGVKYVEVTTSAAWFGTRLVFDGSDPYQEFGFQLDCDGGKTCLVKTSDYNSSNFFQIKSFGNEAWSWCEDPVIFGLLVDMNRRCVTFRLNGFDGPCVRFPNGFMVGADGVRIKMSDFPTDRKGAPPEGYSVVVACATPPVPPSLLEAAANPLDVFEHVSAGSFRDVSGWGYE